MKYEVVSIKDNSVRLRYHEIVFDVKVISDTCGKRKVIKPKDMYFTREDFNIVVAAALSAYETEVSIGEKLTHGKENTEL